MEENESVVIPIKPTDLKLYNTIASKPPELLYHYTDLNGATGIITSKSLWLTKIQHLNDTSELSHGISLFRTVVRQIADKINNADKLNFLQTAAEQLGSFSNTNICIMSFCEDPDLLSQWRSYGNSQCCVALGFSGKLLEELYTSGFMNLWKCVYDNTLQYKIILDLVNLLLRSYDVVEKIKTPEKWEGQKTDIISYFNSTFLQIAPIIKNNYFQEEREWRIITVPIKSTDKNFHAFIRNERTALYYELKFENNCKILDSLVIGPTKESSLIAEGFNVLLRKNGYNFKSISFSQIPYRAK